MHKDSHQLQLKLSLPSVHEDSHQQQLKRLKHLQRVCADENVLKKCDVQATKPHCVLLFIKL